MALSDQKSSTGLSAQDLIDYLDKQQNVLQKRQMDDLARLSGMPKGPAAEILAEAIKERAVVMDQNAVFKERLENGEHPTKVQWDMVEEKAYMIQSDAKKDLQAAAQLIPVSHDPLKPSVHQVQFEYLVEIAAMDAEGIREKIDNAQINVMANEEMVGYLSDDGDHLMADVLQAQGKEAEQRVALLELFENAKLNGQPVDPQKFNSAMEALASASSEVQQARLQADQQKRQLFQSEIANEIGEQLDAMGLSPNEKAVVIKAVADYALDHDDNKPNVVNAKGVAEMALKNLQAGGYQHPDLDDPSEQRIQNAARLALGMKQMVQEDGSVKVARDDVKELNEEKFEATLEAAKEEVNLNGPDAIIGQDAVQAGQELKADLLQRSAQRKAEQEAQQAALQNPAPAVAEETAPSKFKVGDALKKAANNLKNAAANALDRKGSEQKLQDVDPGTVEIYKALQDRVAELKNKPDGETSIDAALGDAKAEAKFNKDPNKKAIDAIEKEMSDMRKRDPGLAQLERSKVGQVIHSKVRDAAKAVGHGLR